MRHARTPRAPFVALAGSVDALDRRYRAQRLSPPVGRCLHGSRVLIMAGHALMPPARTPDARTGACLSVSNVAGESYTAFQRSLATGNVMPRHYAVSVPNAATSELCLTFRVAGPAVTLSEEAKAPVESCPQLVLARDWLGSGIVDRVLIGAIRVGASPSDETRCALVLADRDTTDRMCAAEALSPAARDAVSFLAGLAEASGLSEARGT
ncbi:hypothetical protein [Salinarimonas sp.]|uniref:hypothetical protein n=1 Tax=Salinarimonas sp. TaxID=2766526 RepID=UPI0032D93E42